MFSGHGTVIDNQFYLLPYGADSSTAARLEASAIPTRQFQSKILNLAQHSRVLGLLDACRSARLIGGPLNSWLAADVLRSRVAHSCRGPYPATAAAVGEGRLSITAGDDPSGSRGRPRGHYLFGHLVGDGERRVWNGEAARFGSLEFDYETPQAPEQVGPKLDHGQLLRPIMNITKPFLTASVGTFGQFFGVK